MTEQGVISAASLSGGSNPPPIDQLAEPTKDGAPDENARMNCVFASAAWVVRDIGSEPNCDGDELHDEVVGQGSLGGFDAADARLAAALGKRGVVLSIYRGNQAQLVAKAHEVLAGNGDVLADIPSAWSNPVANPANPGVPTHCIALAHWLTGGLEAMNPWPGFWHSGADGYWAARLCYGRIIIAEPHSGSSQPPAVAVVPASHGVPPGWSDDGTTLRAPNGGVVSGGFRDYVLGSQWDASDMPVTTEQHRSQLLYSNHAFGPGTRQLFTRSALVLTEDAPQIGVPHQIWRIGEMGSELAALEAVPLPPPDSDLIAAVQACAAVLRRMGVQP